MRDELLHRVVPMLERDFQFKKSAKFFIKGVCPECNQKELYAHNDSPWVLRCNRQNECGAEMHIKDLYPELFNTWSDRFIATPKDPNAAADAYLRDARGFDLKLIKGLYAQESFGLHATRQHSATVRFTSPTGWSWERIIDKPEQFGSQKANFKGSYGGQWWAMPHPYKDLIEANEIWITEGIFNAIALAHHGIAAVSIMSCNNFPEAALSQLQARGGAKPKLVWALDNDKAGREATVKYVERANKMGFKSSAAQVPERLTDKDWNDLHLTSSLPAILEECRYEGSLLMAESAIEKGNLIYRRNHMKGWKTFYFEFGLELYWYEAETDKDPPKAFPISNCVPRPLYYQRSEATGESWYYFAVYSANGTHKDTFTGAQLASASEFKKRLLAMAPGALFVGNTAKLDTIVRTSLKKIKTVQTIDFIGYSAPHSAYIFNNLAMKDGKPHKINSQDYFDLSKLQIKSLARSPSIELNTKLDEFRAKQMLTDIYEGYGSKGLVVLAFWLGSFFAEQIRAVDQTYPFLEFVGDPGTGKSTMLEYLWKASGRNAYEGFDPSKSSVAGRMRNFAQISNMPVVMIEGDRSEGNKGSFDFNALKDAFNGRAIMTRGVKNNANDTYEPPFRGAIVISQNAIVATDEAVMQRIVQVILRAEDGSPSSLLAAKRMQRTEMKHISGFMFKALQHEAAILKTYVERNAEYKEILLSAPNIHVTRLAENHAQIAALVHALAHVLPMTDAHINETVDRVVDMTEQRQQDIGADLPLIQQFWDIYDVLNGHENAPMLNHSADNTRIAINLVHFEQVCKRNNVNPPDITQLKRVLRTSKRHKFVEYTSVNSVIARHINVQAEHERMAGIQKCWVFSKK